MSDNPEALLPCPFCGGKAEFERTGTSRQSCIVACGNCGARHESSDEYEQSGASWNTRAALAQQAATPTGDLTVPPPMPEPDGHLWYRKREPEESPIFNTSGAEDHGDAPYLKHWDVIAVHRADRIAVRDAIWSERVASLQARLEAAERDAKRWRMLPAFLEEFQINYVRLILAIDDALDDSADAATQEKPAAPSEGSQG